jgi:hypothetical protein
MSDIVLPQHITEAAARHRLQVWLLGASALIVAVGALFIGHYFGYRSGYQAGYIPEHSHYIFEQKRARVLQKRITDQRRCIDKRVLAIPAIDSGGFAGLGELFRNIGLLYAGTRICDAASGLGVPTRAQLKRIFPSSDN